MSSTDHPQPKRRGRRLRRQTGERKTGSEGPLLGVQGGRYRPLSSDQQQRIHAAVLHILSRIGLREAPADVVRRVTDAGGTLGDDERLTFPVSLVEDAIAGLARGFSLCGQSAIHDMPINGTRVYMGSGGASPTVVDLDTGDYRDSALVDLYDAARLVDALPNVHFFSRSLVARDMPDDYLLDINTAYASLRGTAKHVCVSASSGDNAAAIGELCFTVAGSKAAFAERPFLSFNVNHVTPPLRFATDACAVIEQAATLGIPAHANIFGQVGASSPVSLAGSVAQSTAEALAGMIYGWLVNPEAKMIFGAKPMITDLRTGAMSGGGGEQAMVMAAATQMAQFYDLPNVSIAGATDSKSPDAQSGYEKALSVSLAAQAGSNLITQACGTQASLMGAAFESYVIDNDMLGAILSSLRAFEVSDDSLALDSIDAVVRGEGHFLGEQDTMARMKSDFVYPALADRGSVAEWEDAGKPDMRQRAIARTREILANHHPQHLDYTTDQILRQHFDIRLEPKTPI